MTSLEIWREMARRLRTAMDEQRGEILIRLDRMVANDLLELGRPHPVGGCTGRYPIPASIAAAIADRLESFESVSAGELEALDRGLHTAIPGPEYVW